MDTKNTKEKAYIVSFGNSDKYLLRENRSDRKSSLLMIENELNAFLKHRFPSDTFAYFTSPKAIEIDAKHIDRYLSYPRLDSKAIDSIKATLVKEVEDMEANKRLNSDAPYSDINPTAVGVPHILG